MEAVGEYGGLSLEQTRPIEDVIGGYTYFREGDVLVAKITPCFENGKGAIADELEGGVGFGTTELHVLRAGSGLATRFLFFLTLSEDFRSLGAAEMYGAGGQKRVPERFIRELRHPIPPLDEQRAIAAFLDRETARIDQLIAKKQRLIELLAEKRIALVRHAVTKGLCPDAQMRNTGADWLESVPKHWEVLRLRRVGEVGQGCSFPHAIQGQEDGEVPWFKVNDMNRTGNEISMSDADNYVSRSLASDIGATIFPVGTVIFPRVGAALLTNKRRILACPAIVDDNVYGFIPKGVLPKFAYFLLLVVDMARLCSAGLVPTVTFSVIKDLYIPLPPEAEQQKIVARLESAIEESSQLVAKVDRAIGLAREYRSALISATVTGKIDVRGEVA